MANRYPSARGPLTAAQQKELDEYKERQRKRDKRERIRRERQAEAERRSNCANTLTGWLFDSSENILAKLLEDIIRDNSRQCGNDQRCLIFRGDIFSLYFGKEKYPRPINLLKSSLRPRMIEYLERKAHLDQGKDLAHSYFMAVLHRSIYFHDVIRLIPEELRDVISILYKGNHLAVGIQMTDEEVAQFLSENQDGLKHVQARIAYNMITQN